jgi:sugar porter (SP) family MFS transporter
METFQFDQGLVKANANGTAALLDADGLTIDADDNALRKGLITSSFVFACVFGAAIFSVVADSLGRRLSIIIGGILFAIGGLLQAVASGLVLLIVGRAFSGLSIGTLSMVVPIYIAETAPAHIRGTLTTIYQLMITLGIFIATAVNAILIKTIDSSNPIQWRAALGAQIVPAAFLLLFVFPIPRSPRWLVEKGQYAEAQAAIAKLRGTDINSSEVIAEFDSIKSGIEFEARVGSSDWSELLRPGIFNRLIIGMVNQFFQQWTGINVILYYQQSIFENMGFPNADTLIAFPLANAFINFIATFPGMWAVERFGRKPLLVWGGLVMGIAHALVFVFLTISNSGARTFAWGAVISIYLFIFAFASTWGPVVWSYQAEIFPLRVRAKGTGLCTMTNWLWNAIIAFTFPLIQQSLNFEPSVYWIFAASGFAMFVWSWFAVPETRGKTLEEIDEVFGFSHEGSSVEASAEKK